MAPVPAISFCVPVYNRADQIRTCVESLVRQTLPDEQYEIIIVDDGSTDGSADVAEALFAELGFHQGRVFRLPANSGGASRPRNEAVRHARGEFLFFVDSDDYVAADLAARVCAFAQEHDSDLVYVKYGQVGEGLVPPRGFSERGTIPHADIIQDKLLYATMVHKAFRRSRWLQLGVRFDPAIRVYEDMLVTVTFLFGTTGHSVLADQDYYFLTNHDSRRLHDADQSVDSTFGVYAAVIDEITGSTRDEDYRLRAAAVIVNRLMRYGPAASHPYLSRRCSREERRQWINRWQVLLAHFPVAGDRYVSNRFRNQVRSLRQGNLAAARLAVGIERRWGGHRRLSRLLRGVFWRVTSLFWK